MEAICAYDVFSLASANASERTSLNGFAITVYLWPDGPERWDGCFACRIRKSSPPSCEMVGLREWETTARECGI